MTTYAERLTKIGLVVTEIFGRICQFLLSHPTRCSCYPRNLWVTGPNVTRIVYNVEKCSLYNILKSVLWYCNLFENGSAPKRLANFSTLIGCHGNVLWPMAKYSTVPSSTRKVHMLKRLWKSVQYIWRYSTKYVEPRRQHATLFWLASSVPKLLDRSSPKFYTI